MECARMGMRGEKYNILVSRQKYATSKMVEKY